MENLSQAVLTALAGKQASYPWQQQPCQHQSFQPGLQLQTQGRQSEYMPQQSIIKNIDPTNPL